jgi:hypothetical protein
MDLLQLGVSDLTEKLVSWCRENDGRLVTVAGNCPEGIESMSYESDCWICLMMDPREFIALFLQNGRFRQSLYPGERIDYVWNDVYSDQKTIQMTFRALRPFMNINSVFTGKAPRHPLWCLEK